MLEKETSSPQFPEKGAAPGEDGPEVVLQNGTRPEDEGWSIETHMVHAPAFRTPFSETSEALFLTSGFVYACAEQAERAFKGTERCYQYSRYRNPTVELFEQKLARLEGAEACFATASGMAALFSVMFATLQQGDRVCMTEPVFNSTRNLAVRFFSRYGVQSSFIPAMPRTDSQERLWEKELARQPRLILVESPANPVLDIVDLRRLRALAPDSILVVDNVFATPIGQKPLELGADLVVYSTTKHLDGQGRTMGGAILGSDVWINEKLRPFLQNSGPCLAPFNAWVLQKGLETVALRVRAQSTTAEALAVWLETHPAVQQVAYPFLASFPGEKLARSQMTLGGSLVTFTLRGGKETAFRFMNSLRLILISNNLGDSKSLITHPSTTTHSDMDPDHRVSLGIQDGTVRLSVGLEALQDLQSDLDRALARACSSV